MSGSRNRAPRQGAGVMVDGLESRTMFAVLNANPSNYVSVVNGAASGDTVVFAAGAYGRLTVNGKSNLTLQGTGNPTFSSNAYNNAAAIEVYNSNGIRLDGIRATKSLWGIRIDNSDNTTVINCGVYDIGQEGISVRNRSDFTLIQSTFVHSTGKRFTTEGAAYKDFGEGIYLGSGSNPSADGSTNVTVKFCTIHSTGTEAIDVKPGLTNVRIEKNTIYNVTTRSTVAGIAVGVGGSGTGYVIVRNKIWNMQSASGFASDATGIRVECRADVFNNVIYNNGYGGIIVKNSTGQARIYNNTMHNNASGNLFLWAGHNSDVRNNIGTTVAGNNIASSAGLFVNAAGGDFRLVSTASAAINKGQNLSSIFNDDFDAQVRGSVWDIGADEF
jgi:parallel beta-helix repeat protein